MNSKSLLAFKGSLLSLLLTATLAHADFNYSYHSGHADLFLRYDLDTETWEPGIRVRTTEPPAQIYDSQGLVVITDGQIFDPAETVIRVPGSTLSTAPSGAEWAGLGVPEGSSYYRLFATSVDAVDTDSPYFGVRMNRDDMDLIFPDGVEMALSSFSGPGAFSMFTTDSFGEPTFNYSTADGKLSHTWATTGHFHMNWAFTEPGDYELNFTVNGIFGNDDAVPEALRGTAAPEGQFSYYLTVVPEPGVYALGLGFVVLLVTLYRRRSVRTHAA